MIGLESPIIEINTSTDKLVDFLGDPIKSSFIYQHKSIRQFQNITDGFSFIIKRGALFNFKLKQNNHTEVKFVSKKDMSFESVLSYAFHKEGQLSISFQADTTPYMDFIIEKKVDRWLNNIAIEIQNHFK